jgi:endonuclease I
MEIFNCICGILSGAIACFALYMCRDYSKMLKRSQERFVEAWKTADQYKKMYDAEKKKNERL